VLSAAVKDGRPSHAYLFHGPAGSGKAAAAREFAAELLAEGAADPDDARRRALSGVHPDLTWVRPSGAAEMLRADVEDAVVGGASRTPFESRRRIFVLERADTLNDSAANRLLKTLEEPPPYAHLILLTGRVSDVLPTVRSRCLAVRFEALSPDQLAERLVVEDGAPQDVARACARLARGDARQARTLASASGSELRSATEAFVRAAISGDLRERPWRTLLERSREGGADAARRLAEDVDERARFLPEKDAKKLRRDGDLAGKRAQRRAATVTLDLALHLVALWLRDLICLHDGAAGPVCNSDRMAELNEDLATGVSATALHDGVLAAEDARAMLIVNPTEELLLEALALRLCRMLQTD
jgi:DNA polymerase-3 subunit delta'